MVFLVIIIILLGHNFVSENNEQNVMENISLSPNFVSEIRKMVGVKYFKIMLVQTKHNY